jgi:hypothetical protein
MHFTSSMPCLLSLTHGLPTEQPKIENLKLNTKAQKVRSIALRYQHNDDDDNDEGESGNSGRGGVYQDMTLEDGRVAQMFLAKHGELVPDNSIEDFDKEVAPAPSRPSTKVQGVVIHCLGQVQLKKKPKVSQPESQCFAAFVLLLIHRYFTVRRTQRIQEQQGLQDRPGRSQI